VSGLSPPQAVQELQPARASSTDPPLCPFLRTCSSVPTRFTTIVSAANIRSVLPSCSHLLPTHPFSSPLPCLSCPFCYPTPPLTSPFPAFLCCGRAEDTVSAPSSLLWCPQPPVSLEGLRHASLPRLFADHVLFIATYV
jgi:hypothetical protein